MSENRVIRTLLVGSACLFPVTGHAQTAAPESRRQSATDALNEEIVVTAQKKAAAERVQAIPISISALGEKQLEVLHLRDVTAVSGKIPGVSLEGIGTFKGTPSFSIRGLGPTSSVPSLEPTVSTYVDGVVLGANAGVITDTFDLESIQVLRGPQGTLFGRNAVGGAVLINTARPTRDWSGKFLLQAESGLRGTGMAYTGSAVISGPLTDTLSFKLAGYAMKDNGWFRNSYNNDNYGRDRPLVGRVALLWEPSAGIETLIRYEHGDRRGDAPVSQSHPRVTNGAIVPPTIIDGRVIVNNHSRYSHGVTNDRQGFDYQKWDFAAVETNIGVGFGDGKITNIFGFRQWQRDSSYEVDATANYNFEAMSGNWQRQFSDELRYAGTFGAVDVTAGAFAFQQNLDSRETYQLSGGTITQNGGGRLNEYSVAGFGSLDWHTSEALTLSGGLRYTINQKKVKVGSLNVNASSPPASASGIPNPHPQPTPYCNVGNVPHSDPHYANAPACFLEFADRNVSRGLSFKLGAMYEITDTVRAYASWARAFRSGGYNFRNGSFLVKPGPIRDEQNDSWELGLKAEPARGVRFALDGFYSKLRNLQRVASVLNVINGQNVPVALTINAGDGYVYGVEFEGQAQVVRGLVLQANFALLDARYTRLDPKTGDLNQDGVINGRDLTLDFPKYSPVSYFVGATYSTRAGPGELAFNASFSHRDRQFAADNNIGFINENNNIDANIAYTLGHYQISAYVKNLTDQTQNEGDSDVGSAGTVNAILKKGRVFGLSGIYTF